MVEYASILKYEQCNGTKKETPWVAQHVSADDPTHSAVLELSVGHVHAGI